MNHSIKKGWRTQFLSGKSTEQEREDAIWKLEHHELDYILSVDIFNEGIDIKFVNQILMLRETKSMTVFIQQLGRGLRKYRNQDGIKNYVVILDFIGNYNNNFMIPMALTNDLSYNKENVRRNMVELEFYSQNSFVEFDKISKERIFKSISNNLTKTVYEKDFYNSWQIFHSVLNKIPTHLDFARNNGIDLLYIKKTKYKTYIDFLIQKTNAIKPNTFNDIETKYLRMIFKELAIGKFAYLTNVVLEIINGTFKSLSKPRYLPQFKPDFYINSTNKEYLNILDDVDTVNKQFLNSLNNPEFKKWVVDICEFNSFIYKNKYYVEGSDLKINELYSKKEYSQIIGYKMNDTRNIGGHKHFYGPEFENEHRNPIFVNYKKHHSLSLSLQYADYFEDKQTMIWETKTQRNMQSNSILRLIDDLKIGVKPDLFVRKSTDEPMFYYLGKVDVDYENGIDVPFEENGWKTTKVKFQLKLHNPVKDLIYNYITDLE